VAFCALVGIFLEVAFGVFAGGFGENGWLMMGFLWSICGG
jgi:hypothetical protein